MTMHRFFINTDSLTGDEVTLAGGTARQITRVLRLKPGDRIVVLDNTGWEYETEITGLGRDAVNGKVIRKSMGKAEPGVDVTLCQALIKADRFELVLQKCTELGVKTFRPFACERCVAVKPGEERMARWQAIVREAAEQCGRAVLPVLDKAADFLSL